MDTIVISFICYLIIILIIGIYTSKFTKNINDFALGGQRLGPYIIALSERASSESAWLILGLPGAAFLLGFLEIWTIIGCLSGIFVSWIFIAFPLRKSIEKYKVISLPEFFEKKFNDKTGLLRLTSSIIIIFFFTFYVAAQFNGAGKVLNVTFGISNMEGMIIGAFIIIFYTILGGFLAVAWTDMIQGLIMFSTLVILPIACLIELHSANALIQLDWSNIYDGKSGLEVLTPIIAGLSWGLGYMGQPHLISRYMAINKASNISFSRNIAFSWAIPAFIGAMLIGILGIELIDNKLLVYNGNTISKISDISDPEKIMPILATSLLPSWIAGIFICGAIAAMMSTADSQLLISTTVLTKDISKKYFLINVTDSQLLLYSRMFTFIIGGIAFYMAWHTNNLVFETVSYAWGGLGASFGPALLLSLWWDNVKKEGVFFGIICGTLFTLYPIFSESITPRLSAFIISTLSIIIISKLIKIKK